MARYFLERTTMGQVRHDHARSQSYKAAITSFACALELETGNWTSIPRQLRSGANRLHHVRAFTSSGHFRSDGRSRQPREAPMQTPWRNLCPNNHQGPINRSACRAKGGGQKTLTPAQRHLIAGHGWVPAAKIQSFDNTVEVCLRSRFGSFARSEKNRPCLVMS